MDLEKLKSEANRILRNNLAGAGGLPRTAAWGYPEPYSRDLLISTLGFLASEDEQLIHSVGRVLTTLAENQSPLGQIPSLVDCRDNLGASDTTPLFLLAVSWFRKYSDKSCYLEEATERALSWMDHQRPGANGLVVQLPTTDWRDEQWIMGHGLYVNCLTYAAYQANGRTDSAKKMKEGMAIFDLPESQGDKPYLSAWVYKVYRNDRFDLLGNSLAILSGLLSTRRSRRILQWVEEEIGAMRMRGELALPLAPNFFPFIEESHDDWKERYASFNRPGEYHNGGIWPFVSSLHIAACVKCGLFHEARTLLKELSYLVLSAQREDLTCGFNEWYKAQNGKPSGQDWQTWSCALYLYASNVVEEEKCMYW